MPTNIERSAFRKLEWIGYLPSGHAVRILRNGRRPFWYSVAGYACQAPATPCPTLYARTLKDLGRQLAAVSLLLLLAACAPCITDTQCGGGYAPADTVATRSR